LVPDMFCNFYLVKNHKIVNNSATTEAREKISTYFWNPGKFRNLPHWHPLINLRIVPLSEGEGVVEHLKSDIRSTAKCG